MDAVLLATSAINHNFSLVPYSNDAVNSDLEIPKVSFTVKENGAHR
jgi:hypothetical protein